MKAVLDIVYIHFYFKIYNYNKLNINYFLYSLLTNLLQSDVMLTVMQIVLKRANDLKATCFVDSHLQKVS